MAEHLLDEVRADQVALPRLERRGLGRALGGRLGTIVSARDARIPPPEPKPMMRFAAAAAEPIPIEAGELAVVAVVDVEFNFEQG